MAKGFLSIVLHAHLPFVRHTDTQDCLEQRWLFQGITESYIPLLNSLSRLAESDIPGRSRYPCLLPCRNAEDPLLQERHKAS